MDTAIWGHEMRLSVGELQKILLARALLSKPSLLLLDKAPSSLEPENEPRIYKAIERLQATLTIVLIAYSLSTIRGTDLIVILELEAWSRWANGDELADRVARRF